MNGLAYEYPPEDDELDFELIGGEKYYMAAAAPRLTHGNIIVKFTRFIDDYIEENDLNAEVFGDNTDVYFSDEDHFKPDISVVCDENKISNDKQIIGSPDLIVEVLSDSTRKNDYGIKKDKYEFYGVREYWIVDPYSKDVEVYHLIDGKYHHAGSYNANSDDESQYKVKVSIFEDLTIDLKRVFKFSFKIKITEE